MNNTYEGIILKDTNNSNITNNFVYNATTNGIIFFGKSDVGSSNLIVKDNNVTTADYGIVLRDVFNANVTNNIVKDTITYGIDTYGETITTYDIILANNTVNASNLYGMVFSGSVGVVNSTMENNIINDAFTGGISLNNVNDTIISRNVIDNTSDSSGIRLTAYNYDNVLDSNTVTNSKLYGIYLQNSDNNTIKNNSLSGDLVDFYIDTTDANNTVQDFRKTLFTIRIYNSSSRLHIKDTSNYIFNTSVGIFNNTCYLTYCTMTIVPSTNNYYENVTRVNMTFIPTTASINITVNEYSFSKINFTAVNSTADQLMNITVENGTFPITNGNKYILKKDGSFVSYDIASNGQANFTEVSVGSDYEIYEDITAPTLSLSISLTSIYSGESVTISCSATDDLDSSPSTSISVLKPNGDSVSSGTTFSDTSATGTYTVTCSSTDDASNSASTSSTFTVSSMGGSAPTTRVSTNGKTAITIPSILSGSTVNISIEKTGQPVTEISIKVKRSVSGVKIDILKLEEKPATVVHNVTGKVYYYIKINKTNIQNKDIDKVKIKFTVNKSWIIDNNINESTLVLNRYIAKWEKLPTSKTNETDEEIEYEAESPTLSIFAISGEEIKLVEEEVPTIPEEEIEEEEKPPIPYYWMVIGAIGITAILLVIWKRKELIGISRTIKGKFKKEAKGMHQRTSKVEREKSDLTKKIYNLERKIDELKSRIDTEKIKEMKRELGFAKKSLRDDLKIRTNVYVERLEKMIKKAER